MNKRVRKTIVLAAAVAAVAPTLMGATASAAGDVKIDAKTFPDEKLRIVLSEFDIDGNNSLSAA